MKKPSHPAVKRTGRILPSGVIELEEAGFVEGPFAYESTLEKWLVDHFDQLNLDAALIGSQVKFQKGKKADLLAVLRDGRLCLVENKRDCAPREALAQLLDYAMELNELLPAELDEICHSCHARHRTFKEIYASHFKQAFPALALATPLLVLVADSFEEDEENLALFLNQKHGFHIRLIRFEAEGFGNEKVVKFATVVDEIDQVRPAAEIRPNTFVVRVDERYRHSWEGMRSNNYFAADQNAAEILLLEIEKNEPTIILVYLKWAGFVGYGDLIECMDDEEIRQVRDKGRERPDAALRAARKKTRLKEARLKANQRELTATWDGRVFFKIAWTKTVPREQAYFRSSPNQPARLVEPFADPVLWRVIIGRIHFRSERLKLSDPTQMNLQMTPARPGNFVPD